MLRTRTNVIATNGLIHAELMRVLHASGAPATLPDAE
jgi:hypothetical protein